MDVVKVNLERECCSLSNNKNTITHPYVSTGKVGEGQIHAAVLALQPFEDYVKQCRKEHHTAWKNLKEARNKGYTTRRFTWNERLEEVYAINVSKEVRQGHPMTESYLLESGKLQSSIKPYVEGCFSHWHLPWGVFTKDDVLVGYNILVRQGDVAYYTKIIGHGDYLKDSIMYLLHFDTVKWLVESLEGVGVKYLFYGPWSGGTLGQWKNRVLFKPLYLVEG